MFIAALYGSIKQYLRYRSQLLSMEDLDDHMLSDIGLNRAELRAAAWRQAERSAH
ncbi:MAG: DUF1127 domain-containing protein [Bradyrhizobium sp.]|uniref:DUF1127 domain-containing protein n=1 Tax=Bradyrhizobium sp. TaxID=376 RepID=UPI001DDE08EE|nr:DUF1127 domain-containing protein [Bradyrhizobium sp.]MBV9561510.1 DUF1127 domain-containing protein [Bradyrhizobium sp.]